MQQVADVLHSARPATATACQVIARRRCERGPSESSGNKSSWTVLFFLWPAHRWLSARAQAGRGCDQVAGSAGVAAASRLSALRRLGIRFGTDTNAKGAHGDPTRQSQEWPDGRADLP